MKCLQKGITLVSVLVVGGFTASCSPTNVADSDACAPVNVNITELKDIDRVNQVTDHIDRAMNTLMAAASPGSCSVVMVAGDKIKTINGYGDPREQGSTDSIPSTWPASTPYYVGSISKTITAVAILKMIEQNNNMSIDDTIGEHLSDYDLPRGWSNITIRELLSHTSGAATNFSAIDDEASLIAAFPNAGAHPGIHPRYAYESYKDGIPSNVGFQQQFTARYSNIGYSLLGLIIDDRAATGAAADASGYERYVYDNVGLNERRLTEPTMLSMCLGTSWRAPKIQNLAAPTASSGAAGSVFRGNGWEGPSGGWTMTVGDLGRLMIIIQKNKRITASTKAQMMTRQGRDNGNKMTGETGDAAAEFALGVAVEPKTAEPYFAKGGDITGYTSNFKYYTDADVGAGILCSRNNLSHSTLLTAIEEILAPCLVNSINKPNFCSSIGGLELSG